MKRTIPHLVIDKNSASGFRVEHLSIEVDAELARQLDACAAVDAPAQGSSANEYEALRQAIIEHTRGEKLFWLGEMLLSEVTKAAGNWPQARYCEKCGLNLLSCRCRSADETATKSAPVQRASHNSGEGDPMVTLDRAGADTHSPAETATPFAWCREWMHGPERMRDVTLASPTSGKPMEVAGTELIPLYRHPACPSQPETDGADYWRRVALNHEQTITQLRSQVERLTANHKNVVETKRITDDRLRAALAGLQKIYDESTDDTISEIAGKAFDEATHERPRSSAVPSTEQRDV